MLGLLGFMGCGVSIPAIVRKVQGRIDKCTRNDDGTYSYGEDDPVTVTEAEHKVIQSPKVAKALKTVYIGPLLNIDKSINVTVQSKQEFEAKSTAGTVADQSDVYDMEGYEHIAAEGIPEEHEDIVSTMHNVPVHPCSGPYDGGENGYSFSYMKEKWSRVQMHDFDFRMKMESGEVRLMRRDLLIVDLEVVQSITKSGKESSRRAITKVHEYRAYKPSKQMTIEDAGVDMDSNTE